MPAHLPLSTTPDALYYAGTLVRLVRALDQQLRAAMGPDPLTTTELSVLGRTPYVSIRARSGTGYCSSALMLLEDTTGVGARLATPAGVRGSAFLPMPEGRGVRRILR